MFGDMLLKNISLLKNSDEKKTSNNSFWIILRRIAVLDILNVYPGKVDSDIAVPIYYKILKSCENYIPSYFKVKLKSNNQERYRVINRNLWTSNAFHPDGLANQREIKAEKEINEAKKGDRIVYQGVVNYVDK